MGALDPFDRRRLRNSDMILLAVEKQITWQEARRWCFVRWLVANGRLNDQEPIEILVRPARRFVE